MTNPEQAQQSPYQENGAAERLRTSTFAVLVTSLIAMLPWPLIAIGIGLAGEFFEQEIDAAFAFGGVTLIFLLPLALLEPPDWVFAVLFFVIWGLVLVLPALFATSQKLKKKHLALAYIFQAGFSVAQAGLGLLMILGRNV